jgi:hypothetical protein
MVSKMVCWRRYRIQEDRAKDALLQSYLERQSDSKEEDSKDMK